MKYKVKIKRDFFGFSDLSKFVTIEFKGTGLKKDILEEIELIKKEVEKL